MKAQWVCMRHSGQIRIRFKEVLIASMSCCAVSGLAQAQVNAFPGEYVVTLPPIATGGPRMAAARSGVDGARVLGTISSDALLVGPAFSTSALSFSDDAQMGIRKAEPVDPADTFCKELLARRVVASCSPNYELKITADPPNDPRLGELWGLSQNTGIDAVSAWNVTGGSKDAVVAILDTGVDYNHPDLRENMWRNSGEIEGNGKDDDGNGVVDDVYGYNAITGAAQPGNPMDDNMHGTHVAGTIGAVGNNRIGVVGVNQHVKIMPLKFLNSSGSGSLSDAIKAIDYMISMKRSRGINIRVSNNSWGGGSYSQPLADAITRARDAGIIFVAAAGNEANDNDVSPSYPAGYDLGNVVSVAAVDKDGNVAPFSNYGATQVDIAAPGVSIVSTAPNGQYAALSGTSMATPHVTGALALLFASEQGLAMEAAINRVYDAGKTLDTLVAGGNPLVRTQRMLNVGRMLRNETSPIPMVPSTPNNCSYSFQYSNLAFSGGIDTSADAAPIVNRADEGSFYKVKLPFQFPFYGDAIDTLYLSPNGVVYVRAPGRLDYEIGAVAPASSIAALHADLTPTRADHGVRVAMNTDHVTIAWVDNYYIAQGQGDVLARMTIFSNGTIQTSVAFGGNGELSDLRSKVLGNPFTSPATAAAAVIGITGTSGLSPVAVDLAAAQRTVLDSPEGALILGVSMTPTCGILSPPLPSPTVQSIALKQIRPKRARTNGTLTITLRGAGSGVVPLRASVNGVVCGKQAQIQLTSGKAALKTLLPALPVRVAFASGAISKSVKVRSSKVVSRRATSQRIERMCRTIMNHLKP